MQRYAPGILAIIRRYIYDIDGYDEQDIVQEIWMAAHKILSKFRGDDAAFQCWLRRSTKGLCLNILAKQHKHETIPLDALCVESLQRELPNSIADPATALRNKERETTVEQAIQALPEQFRKVVVLNIEGNSYDAIAAILGIEVGTVKSRLNRARGILKEKLRDV